MPASIFIAKLLGPLFIVVGIALLSKTRPGPGANA